MQVRAASVTHTVFINSINIQLVLFFLSFCHIFHLAPAMTFKISPWGLNKVICLSIYLPYNLYGVYRSADIALVAGGNRKRWIIATENMHIGDIIKTSGAIGRMAGVTFASRSSLKCQRFSGCRIILVWYLEMNTTSLLSLCHFAVLANEGDAYPLGALPVGTLVNNLEIQPGKGAEYIRAAGKVKFCLGF